MTRFGTTKFDNMVHQIFRAHGNGTDFLSRETGIKCGTAGASSMRITAKAVCIFVECHRCKIKALVEAGSPLEATYKTFAHAIYPVDEMGEDEAVFFDHVPIDEPPVYVGSVIDTDFPEDVACGMYLPCPGTDGMELDVEKPKDGAAHAPD